MPGFYSTCGAPSLGAADPRHAVSAYGLGPSAALDAVSAYGLELRPRNLDPSSPWTRSRTPPLETAAPGPRL